MQFMLIRETYLHMKTDKLGVTRLINILDFIFSMSTIEMIIPITKIV